MFSHLLTIHKSLIGSLKRDIPEGGHEFQLQEVLDKGFAKSTFPKASIQMTKYLLPVTREERYLNRINKQCLATYFFKDK